jgi:hypothetical protein
MSVFNETLATRYLLDEVTSYNSEQPSIFELIDEKSRKLRVKSAYSFHMYISQAPC